MSISLSASTLGFRAGAFSRRTRAPAFAPQPAGDVRRLGAELIAASGEVGARAATRGEGEPDADETLRCALERVATVWTIAVGRWMAGEGEQAARETGRECLRIFQELAARRAAPVNEIVQCCLRWRDAASALAEDSAGRLELSAQALSQVRAMLQRSLEVTILRVCEAFEAERRRADEELTFQATHDALTGLANRTLIAERIARLLAGSPRGGARVALLFIDVDNFKVVNDTLGHSAGDELLRALTRRLAGVVPSSEDLGRLGGDEFLVVVDEGSWEPAERVARRVLDAFSEPFTLAGGAARLQMSASVGVALAHCESVEELLRDADVAMYRAKEEGKNRYAVLAHAPRASGARRARLDGHLDRSLLPVKGLNAL